jgi:hypothetical protein
MIGSFFTRVARATRVRTPLSSSLPLHRTLSSQIDATERVRQKFAWNDKYPPRHLGVTKATDIARMLKQLRVDSIDTLIDKTVPQSIRNPDPLDMTPSRGEHELLGEFQTMMNKNQVFRTHIGCGCTLQRVPATALNQFPLAFVFACRLERQHRSFFRSTSPSPYRPRHGRAKGDCAQHAGESCMVHALHAIPGGFSHVLAFFVVAPCVACTCCCLSNYVLVLEHRGTSFVICCEQLATTV